MLSTGSKTTLGLPLWVNYGNPALIGGRQLHPSKRPVAASIVRSVPRPSLLPASKNLHKNRRSRGTLSTAQLAV